MATDAQTLLAEAKCYRCYDTLDLIKVSLLAQLLRLANPMADTSPQALLAYAKCYSCYGANAYQLQLMELALLAQLVGTGGFRQYSPDTPGDFVGQVAYRANCFGFFVWDGTQWILQDPLTSGGIYFRPTIVELRQVETQVCVPVAAFTDGNLVVGDNQAAAYRWDPDSTDADDGMGTIMPDDRLITDPGRWKQRPFA